MSPYEILEGLMTSNRITGFEVNRAQMKAYVSLDYFEMDADYREPLPAVAVGEDIHMAKAVAQAVAKLPKADA